MVLLFHVPLLFLFDGLLWSLFVVAFWDLHSCPSLVAYPLLLLLLLWWIMIVRIFCPWLYCAGFSSSPGSAGTPVGSIDYSLSAIHITGFSIASITLDLQPPNRVVVCHCSRGGA